MAQHGLDVVPYSKLRLIFPRSPTLYFFLLLNGQRYTT